MRASSLNDRIRVYVAESELVVCDLRHFRIDFDHVHRSTGIGRLDVARKRVAAAADEERVDRLPRPDSCSLREIRVRALVAVTERGRIVEDDEAVNESVEHQGSRRPAVLERLVDLDAVVVGLHLARRAILAGVPSHAARTRTSRTPARARAVRRPAGRGRAIGETLPTASPVISSTPATIQTMLRVPSQEISQNPVRNVPTIDPAVEKA